MNNKVIEKKIHAIMSRPALTFAHKRDRSRPEQYSLHLNDHVEIYVYISGNTHYVIDDRYYVLERGDILVIPPYSTHVPILKSECDYERFYLLVPIGLLSVYSHDPLHDLIGEARGRMIRLTEEKRERALELLYHISNVCSSTPRTNTDLLLHALALEFICLICENEQGTKAERVENLRSLPKLIKEVLAYISASSAEISGIAAIAARFYVSEQYLSTAFKKHVGVTVSSYLRAAKISVAKRLLEEGHTVTYTCYECGFNDCSYFIKVFREIVGTTPKKYLEQYKSNTRLQ